MHSPAAASRLAVLQCKAPTKEGQQRLPGMEGCPVMLQDASLLGVLMVPLFSTASRAEVRHHAASTLAAS